MGDALSKAQTSVDRLLGVVAKATPLPLPGFTPADLDEAPNPTPYWIKGILDQGDIGTGYGDSGVMKSFLFTDMLCHVAVGAIYCGHRVVQTAVLIIAGEGGSGMKKRIRAWELHHGARIGRRPKVFVATLPADLMADKGTIAATIAHAEKVLGATVGIVCFDTLSSSFGDGDENSSTDMARVLRTARETCGNRTVLLVHHVGHGDKGRERGSYALRGNVDFRIQVERPNDGRIITVSSKKQKDGEPFGDLHFEWKQIETGWRDIDGDPITSVILEPTNAVPQPMEPTGKVQKAILDQLRVTPTKKADLAKQLESAGNSRTGTYRAARMLVDAGLIHECGSLLSVVTPP